MDMRFAAHLGLTLNRILKRDHRGMLVATRNDYGGPTPTNFGGGGPDAPHKMVAAFVRVQIQDGLVKHPVSRAAWDLTGPRQPKNFTNDDPFL